MRRNVVWPESASEPMSSQQALRAVAVIRKLDLVVRALRAALSRPDSRVAWPNKSRFIEALDN